LKSLPVFSIDLFCRVVDNFGDAGVCWRLARQLAGEFGLTVRLLIDDIAPLRLLVPGATKGAIVDQVTICHWQQAAALQPADCVIEAFACELPPKYVEAMAGKPRRPVWINLEYLSAEAWVAQHHLMPSPHPRLPLTKYFFFPGFVEKTGGLIREQWVGKEPEPSHHAGNPLQVFVFSYPNRALPGLLETWRTLAQPPHLTIADGPAGTAALSWRTSHDVARSLQISILPFCPQREFDALLARHDVLFVRGEDSFIRAQWAAKPFVWHIYPQQDDAHWQKLNAFLDHYCTGMTRAAAGAVRSLWTAWNREDGSSAASAWHAFAGHLPEIRSHAGEWAMNLRKMPDLATNLVTFYQKTVKM